MAVLINRNQLCDLLAKLRNCQVVVVGDLILDRFIWGKINRISPEAPVPVVAVERTSMHPGGAANVAANLASLGVQDVSLLGVVGKDPAGRDLKMQVEDCQISSDGFVIDPTRVTTVKSRIMACQQQICRTDLEDRTPVSKELAQHLYKRFLEVLQGADAVILSDYAKGVLTPDLCQLLINASKQLGVPVAVDPKTVDFSRYSGATLITPNLAEFHLAAGVHAADSDAELLAATALIEKTEIEALLVTRGEGGMTLFRQDGSDHIRAAAKQVFDVTGAGDTVIAMVSSALACGCSSQDASALANLAAGAVVAKLGTAAVTPEDLKASLPG